MKYRIVQAYGGEYLVQKRLRFWPFWSYVGGFADCARVFHSDKAAREYIRRLTSKPVVVEVWE